MKILKSMLPILLTCLVLTGFGFLVFSLFEPLIVDNNIEAEIKVIIQEAKLHIPDRWDKHNGEKLEPKKIVVEMGVDGEQFSPYTGEDITKYKIKLIYNKKGDYDAYLVKQSDNQYYDISNYEHTIKELRENINTMYWN